MTSPKDSDSTAVTNLKVMYEGCMDTDAIEENGLAGIPYSYGAEGEFGGWPMVQDSWSSEKYFLSVLQMFHNSCSDLTLPLLLEMEGDS